MKEKMTRWPVNKILAWILVFGYLWIIFNAQAFLIREKAPKVLAEAAIVLGIVLICVALFRKRDVFSISLDRQYERKTIWIITIAGTAICFCVLLLYYIAYYPGSFSGDIINQYEQALSGVYYDWHPALHTFLFYTVPLRLFGNFGAVILMQIIYFSLAVGYLMRTLARRGLSLYGIMMCFVLIVGNPETGNILMAALKDNAMGIFAIIAIAYAVNCIWDGEKWLGSRLNQFCMALFLALLTIVRHNAILFTAPFLFGLLVLCKKSRKKIIMVSVGTLLLCGLIRGPFYSALNVQDPGDRPQELLGMPMTILANVLVNDSEALSEDAREFLYQIASQEEWEETYEAGNWNSVKWTYESTDIIIEEGTQNILSYTLDACIRSPKYALLGFLELTSLVWGIDGDVPSEDPYYGDNDYGIVCSGNDWLRSNLSYIYKLVSKSDYVSVIFSIGFPMMVLILLGGANYECLLRNAMVLLPVLSYNFGTMLLLSGPDYRMFIYTVWIFAPCAVMTCAEKVPDAEVITKTG